MGDLLQGISIRSRLGGRREGESATEHRQRSQCAVGDRPVLDASLDVLLLDVAVDLDLADEGSPGALAVEVLALVAEALGLLEATVDREHKIR